MSTKRVYSDNRPDVFEINPYNGTYMYHWDIKEETIIHHPDESPSIQFSYFEVIADGLPERESLTGSVIHHEWDTDYEKKLINDYNAATLGELEEEYIERYKNFIIQRKALKAMVAEDIQHYYGQV